MYFVIGIGSDYRIYWMCVWKQQKQSFIGKNTCGFHFWAIYKAAIQCLSFIYYNSAADTESRISPVNTDSVWLLGLCISLHCTVWRKLFIVHEWGRIFIVFAYPKTKFEKSKELLPLRDRETRLVLCNGNTTISIWLSVYQLMEAGVINKIK